MSNPVMTTPAYNESQEKVPQEQEPKADKQRKDKSLPLPKNRRSPRKIDSKKDGHGKFNWGSWKDDVHPDVHPDAHSDAHSRDINTVNTSRST